MTVTTDVLIFPKIPAEKATDMYISSKMVEKMLHPSNLERRTESSKLAYFNAKYKLETMIKTLNLKRITMKRHKENTKRDWEVLRMMVDDFRKHIVRADDFITNNQEKRQRVRQKIQQSSDLIKAREEQIETIQADIKWLKSIKEKMEEKINDYSIYEDYLNLVVKNDSLRFRNIQDVILKDNDMRTARVDIISHQESREMHLQNSQAEMKKLLSEKFLKHMELTTDLSKLSSRYKTAKRTSLTAENIISTIYQESITKKLQYVAVKKTCWRLYLHMYQHKYTYVTIKQEDTFGQLREITKVMGLLSQIFRKLGIIH